jgi:17beta-estradiol 17-dehydrogenase / very-long-chain 3-oxoacyl-CoA reductase
MSYISAIIFYTGLVTILYSLAFLGIWIYNTFIFQSTRIKKLAENGAYAVITGATAGIGEGYAQELAKRGFNLVLVSRSETKLKTFSDELSNEYKVKVEYVVVDFAKPTANMYSQLKKKVSNMRVTVLVNNVGINTEIPEYFLETPESVQEDFINVNIRACLDVTRIVLPIMKSNKSGLIINLSSFAGKNATPLMSLYSASKAFMDSWSTALRGEYAPDGIEVLSLVPMFVQSSMSGFKHTSMTVPSSRAFASKSLAMVGSPVLPLSVSPWWAHAIVMYAISFIPEFFKLNVLKGQMVANAKRLKAKKEKEGQSK